jgi:nucleoid-associated protein YgaU
MKKLLLGCAAGLFSLFANAVDTGDLKNGHPDSYQVVKGDTLWDISSTFLKNPWLWPEIWHVNPQIENPHLIFPGDVLSLVYIKGEAKLVVKRGELSRTVKLTPEVRISPLQNAIPAIPLEKINAFLTRSRILDQDLMADAPYILAGSNKRIISAAGDRLYARGVFDKEETVYGIYRRGRVFSDPQTEEVLGLEALDIGGGKVVALDGDVATVAVNRSNEEIRLGDRLLAFEERQVTATFFPSSPESKVSGVLMAVEGGVSQIGTMDIVALNKGERDGLEEGNVMAIYKAGEVARDRVTEELIQLPDVKAGLLMVFRTFDKMAYGIVVDASQPLSVMDKFKNP